jgi:hypothetical protein
MTMIGYHPVRVTDLRIRTIGASQSFQGTWSSDSLASAAMSAVRELRDVLQQQMIPLLDRIHHSDAMETWRRSNLLDGTLTADGNGVAPADAWFEGLAPDGSEFRDLDDGELLDRYEELIHDVRHDWPYPDDDDADALSAVLTEMARRARSDPPRTKHAGFARVTATRLGEDGIEDLLEFLDAADPERYDGFSSMQLSPFERERYLTDFLDPGASLIGMMSSRSDVADTVMRWSPQNQLVGEMFLAASDAFPPSVIRRSLEQHMEYYDLLQRSGAWTSLWMPERNISATMLALATYPEAAHEFLSHTEHLGIVLERGQFDDTAVEQVITSGLGVAVALDPSRLESGYAVVERVVDTADDVRLSDGARRGVASSLAAYIDTLAPALHDGRSVIVVVDGQPIADLGSYDDVAAMLGEVADDEQSQATLGFITTTYLNSLTAQATSSTNPGSTTTNINAVSSILNPAVEFADLIVDSLESEQARLAFEHGSALAGSKLGISILSSVASALVPPAMPLVKLGATVGGAILTAAISETDPDSPIDLGENHRLPEHVTVGLLDDLVTTPSHRERLGVGDVADATWSELDALIDEYRGTTEPGEQYLVYLRIDEVLRAEAPELSGLVREVLSDSNTDIVADD